MSTTTEETLRVSVQVVKTRAAFSRKNLFVAKLGRVEASGGTKAIAKDFLAKEFKRIFEDLTGPVVMFDLAEPGKVWIAHPGPDGWSYTIARQWVHPSGELPHVSRETSFGVGCWSRAECLEHMRDHWYQCNAQLIVEGIVGLFTLRRRWKCAKCDNPNEGLGPSYKCQNPACGHETSERRASK